MASPNSCRNPRNGSTVRTLVGPYQGAHRPAPVNRGLVRAQGESPRSHTRRIQDHYWTNYDRNPRPVLAVFQGQAVGEHLYLESSRVCHNALCGSDILARAVIMILVEHSLITDLSVGRS